MRGRGERERLGHEWEMYLPVSQRPAAVWRKPVTETFGESAEYHGMSLFGAKSYLSHAQKKKGRVGMEREERGYASKTSKPAFLSASTMTSGVSKSGNPFPTSIPFLRATWSGLLGSYLALVKKTEKGETGVWFALLDPLRERQGKEEQKRGGQSGCPSISGE